VHTTELVYASRKSSLCARPAMTPATAAARNTIAAARMKGCAKPQGHTVLGLSRAVLRHNDNERWQATDLGNPDPPGGGLHLAQDAVHIT
jgi:hypothetical protein